MRSRSRSESDSPTHTIGVMPFSSSAWTFVFTSSSVSPLFARRSLWPTMQYAPRSAIMSTLISPGVRALIELGDVLRADADAPRLFARERGEMRRRDAENDAAPVHARGQLRFQLLDERLYARGKLVHFPVSGDDDFSVFLVHRSILPFADYQKSLTDPNENPTK